MRKFNIQPSVAIFTLGFIGLVFSLVESNKEIGSKIPLALLFIFIMMAGIALQIAPKDMVSGEFGEVDSGGYA